VLGVVTGETFDDLEDDGVSSTSQRSICGPPSTKASANSGRIMPRERLFR
jgi:hypothetical protein